MIFIKNSHKEKEQELEQVLRKQEIIFSQISKDVAANQK